MPERRPAERHGGLRAARCLAALLLLAAGASGARAGDGLFLWEIRAKGSTAWLLGSVHMLGKGGAALDRRIEDAYSGSDALVVETDVDRDDQAGLAAVAAESALYPAGDSLRNHLSAKSYAALSRALGGAVPAPAEAMRPWALAMTMTVARYGAMGLSPENGVDRHFLGRARRDKRILELEPGAEPLRALAAMPDELQEKYLLYTIAELDRIETETRELLDAWSAGDAGGMEAILTRSVAEHPDLAPVYALLVDRRNREMAGKIEGYLAQGGRYFVVVGAAHLVGARGIPELLARKGYAVRRVAPSPAAAAR